MKTSVYLRNAFFLFTIITATISIIKIWIGEDVGFAIEWVPTSLITGITFGILWISVLIHRLINTFAK